jgi:pimeloyl-ACP methyl ester carboxylesterase
MHWSLSAVSGCPNTAGTESKRNSTSEWRWPESLDLVSPSAFSNRFHHFKVDIENLTVHFIHEKSTAPNAIPLILHHGWPGSFLEFVPLVKSLTQESVTSDGKAVAFDVIVPSLPGFAISSPPPENWTVDDTARVFNTLMTDVLGYSKYATHGTDWGCGVSYSLYDNFNASVRAAHFAFLPFFPLQPDALAAQNISLSALEQSEEENYISWSTVGNGYFSEQSTKVREMVCCGKVML